MPRGIHGPDRDRGRTDGTVTIMRIPPMTTVWALSALVLLLPGCVERKMFIRSDPPATQVYVEDELVGSGPVVEVPFIWAGERRITVMAPGHRVLETTAELEDPWFTYFPLDLLAEFVWPGTIRDHQEFAFTLEPYYPIDQPLTDAQSAELSRRMEELGVRAEEYRAGGADGPGAVPATDPTPPPESGDGR